MSTSGQEFAWGAVPGKVLRRSPWHASWWRVGPTLDAGAAPAGEGADHPRLDHVLDRRGRDRNSPMHHLGSRLASPSRTPEGGVDGHKIIPLVIDDQTEPNGGRDGRPGCDLKGRLRHRLGQSTLFHSPRSTRDQAGIPVTGGSFDGPEWGQQPYTNMFAADTGSVDPNYPVEPGIGAFLKSHGGTVIGSYGYGISPSSARSAEEAPVKSFEHVGGGVSAFFDTSVPFGSVDFASLRHCSRSRRTSMPSMPAWTTIPTSPWPRDLGKTRC